MRKNALAGWLLLSPSLALIGGLILYPILYNLWLSLFDKHAFMPVQSFVGLRHYRYFATDPEFWSSFYYGVVYAAVTMVFQLGLGVAAALLLNEAFQGRNVRYGSIAAGSVFVFLGILVGVNYISNRQHKRWDLTAAKQFSLSDQTRKILGDLKKPLVVRAFYGENVSLQ